MTRKQAKLFADYILGMPDRNGAAEYVRFSAFRLDDTFFNELQGMISEARKEMDSPRERSLEWLSSVASDAKGRAYAPFHAAAQPSQRRAAPEVQTDYSRAMQVIELDKRVTGMMMRTHFNPADDAVIADWKSIVDGYRELIEAGPPQTRFYTVESLRLKVAQSLESLARAYQYLADGRQSRTYYEQAASAYEDAGQTAEAARCRSRLAEERMIEEAGYNDQLRTALEDLERLDKSQPEYYSRLVDLGELQAHVGDNFAAEKTLLEAESGLGRAKQANPTGEDLANALLETLRGMQGNKSVSPRQNIVTSLQVRGLYQRIHLRLANIYEHLGDLTKAEDRLNRAREMDRYSHDDEFSTTMRDKLAGEWKDLFR